MLESRKQGNQVEIVGTGRVMVVFANELALCSYWKTTGIGSNREACWLEMNVPTH